MIEAAATQFFYVSKPRSFCRRQLVIQQAGRVRRNRTEKSVDSRELAGDLLPAADLLNGVDGDGVAVISQLRPLHTVLPFNFDEPVIDRAGQMRAGPAGLTTAQWRFIQNDHGSTLPQQQICSGQPRDTCAHDAHVGMGVSAGRTILGNLNPREPNRFADDSERHKAHKLHISG
jgi:hypothetical protein